MSLASCRERLESPLTLLASKIALETHSLTLFHPRTPFHNSVEYIRGKEFYRWMTEHPEVVNEYLPGLDKPLKDKASPSILHFLPRTLGNIVSFPCNIEPSNSLHPSHVNRRSRIS